MVVALVHLTLGVVIALFLLQVLRHLLASSRNGVATSTSDALAWLLAA